MAKARVEVDVERIEVLGLGPDDVLVATLPAHTTAANVQAVKAIMDAKFGEHRVLVKSEVVDLSVVSRETLDDYGGSE